jgi:hypothetical protein
LDRTFRLLAAVLAMAIFASLAQSASAATPSKGRGGKVTIEIVDGSQAKALKRGVKVRVESRRRHVRVQLGSSTYDAPRFSDDGKPAQVRLGADGVGKRKLKLSRPAKRAYAGCEERTLRVRGSGGADQMLMKRDTKSCRPKKVNLSASNRCDFIGAQKGSLCLLPFPDDYYTVKDKGTVTGRRIDLRTASMPANADGVHMDADPYGLNDGFSPGQPIVVKVPGLDTPAALEKTGSVRLTKLSDYARPDAPIVVIDANTEERWPIWTEIDAKAEDPGRAALLIHPARNFDSGHRYIVVMRNLKNSKGKTLKAPEGFRYFRDALPTKKRKIKRQRGRFDSLFNTLRQTGIDRSDLYLTWDFTVASDENIAGRLLHMRDDAYGQLGDDSLTDLQAQGGAPEFQLNPQVVPEGETPGVTDYTSAEDPDMARRVAGTFTVPCYLAPDCDTGVPGGTFDLDETGMPVQHGTYTADFVCMIPRTAVDGGNAVRPSLYGHGLLGGPGETVSDPQKTLGNDHGFAFCGTSQIGLSSADVPLALTVLGEMGKFPQVADRLQQGLLDEMMLGRLMISPGGFATDPAFHVNDSQPVGSSPYVIDPARLYYNGNSQGAIGGGAFVATSPDVTRGSLGVGGMNYSVLLNRSVDFDKYAQLGFEPAYPDELAQPLVLSLIQMLWDRGESNGYAHRMTDHPLPDTPAHEVLMNVAFGDHQVSNFAADTMARTIGAKVHSPVVYDGRWPGVEPVFDVPRIGAYPFTRSALVYWDSGPVRPNPTPSGETTGPQLGTDPPPIENVPNTSGQDPHELPRRTAAEQQMISDFLQPNLQSHIDDECAGPCYDYTFSGP